MKKTMDEKIEELFLKVETEKNKVQQMEEEAKQKWLTNCSYNIDGNKSFINIQTANIETIKHLTKDLLIQKKYLQEACEILELNCDNKINGFVVEEWIKDCKKRISIIQIKQKQEELQEMEKTLNELVSPEKKREMKLAAIEKALNS